MGCVSFPLLYAFFFFLSSSITLSDASFPSFSTRFVSTHVASSNSFSLFAIAFALASSWEFSLSSSTFFFP